MRSAHVSLVLSALVFTATVAHAEDRRAEAAAKDALQAAQAEFASGAYEKALTRLRRASRGCAKCSAAMRAQLLRDTGATALESGDAEQAVEAFQAALKLEPAADLTPRYATAGVRAAWEAAKDEAAALASPRPTGDFDHTPPTAGLVHTPLAIYVESSAPLEKVTVRYRAAGDAEYARLDLRRAGNTGSGGSSGKGWGGLLPCEAAKQGILRYYLVGVDASGTPVATSGDARHPFVVPIRRALAGPPPALPGQAPPVSCADGAAEPTAARVSETERHESAPSDAEPPRREPFRRYWFGIAGSLDFGGMPSGQDVCRVGSDGQPSSGVTCTDPNGGADFPASSQESQALVPGKAGNPSGGIAAGDVRAMVTFDYALSARFLVGARLGYVANGYPGKAAASAGNAFGPSLHVEARATLLFGDEPLARVGFAPLVMGALGVAEFDTSQTVDVAETGIAGQRSMLAWRTAGPFFAAVGGGVRYAFSDSIGFSSLVKATAAMGGSGIVPFVSPELGLAYGF